MSCHPQTTLLNHILKVQSTKRIMVIENEVRTWGAAPVSAAARHCSPSTQPCVLQFGEISIDSDKMVVARNDTTEIIELPNGCACCDVQAELVDSLYMIVRTSCALLQLTFLARSHASRASKQGVRFDPTCTLELASHSCAAGRAASREAVRPAGHRDHGHGQPAAHHAGL